jgi:hypothetical protein
MPVVRPPLRLAWVAVAILAVLALVGGLLVAGALRNAPAPLLSECPAGTTPNEPGPVDQERPGMHGDIGQPVWAGDHGVIVVARGRPSPPELVDGVLVADRAFRPWSFDVCTNTWHEPAGASATFPSDDSPQLAYEADADRLVAISAPSVWLYDLHEERWSSGGPTPTGMWRPHAIYDPVTGLVVVLDGQRNLMWTYDADTRTWAEIEQGATTPARLGAGFLVTYDASADRLVLWSIDVRTWEFDLRAHVWTETARSATPEIRVGWTILDHKIVYDEANRRVLIFSDGVVAAYDATADSWEIAYGTEFTGLDDGLGYGPYNRLYHVTAYDPLNRRMLVFGGAYRAADPETGEFLDWVATDDVMAFDLATGTWTELLAPSE